MRLTSVPPECTSKYSTFQSDDSRKFVLFHSTTFSRSRKVRESRRILGFTPIPQGDTLQYRTYPCVPLGRSGSCTTTRRPLRLRRRTGALVRITTNHSTEPSSQSSC